MINLIIIGLLVAGVLATSIYFVGPKEVATVTRFGRYVRTGQSGLNFKIPFFIEQVDMRLSAALLQEQETVRVKTLDNAYVDMPVQVFYRINESSNETVYQAAYNLENPAEQILQLAAKETRSNSTSMTLEALFQDKTNIENSVRDDLEEFVSGNGFIIDKVVVDEPSPSQDVQDASNGVIASDRLKDAAQAKADATRIERVGEAQADAQALKERASAFAESRETIANGMTQAASVMRDQTEGLDDAGILQVLEGVDWRDALISCSKSEGTLIVDSGGQGHGLASTAGLLKGVDQSGVVSRSDQSNSTDGVDHRA